ncbi:MAG: bifunctional aspartate kinase/diaminopimelate decarboxylase [Woeseia sp.]
MPESITEAPFPASGTLGAGAAIANSDWVVLKFGGSSVASVENWKTIAGVVRNRRAAGLRVLVVHSAVSGVSNDLEKVLGQAAQGGGEQEIAALRERHLALANDMQVDGASLLASHFAELEKLAAGLRLIGEVSPRVHARMMALGELMSTTLGAAWLNSNDIATEWLDVREVLQSRESPRRSLRQNFLSATCGYEPDKNLPARLAASGKVILTQGFIAHNAQQETVLLGREGSDTSAAYLAARLQAHRLEIWTDVPGMFTADPRLVPSARLLAELHFEEAQELASTGSRVLHPRCLRPLREYSIPLFIRCTGSPQIAGTVISAVTSESQPQVKGVSARRNVTLISMEGSAMWHEVGFLAEAFACFSKHGVSIDLVSTSQTNVTVSIETADQMLPPDVQRALVEDLSLLCRVRVIEQCAVVSLVGKGIRTILPRIAPTLRVFDDEKIHLVSQAASDLNFSFVIDESQLQKLVGRIHSSVIPAGGNNPVFGPSWEFLFTVLPKRAAVADIWWLRKREHLLELLNDRPHAFVYDAATVKAAAIALQQLESVDRVLYAMKANFNVDILRLLHSLAVDFECVSPGEVKHLRAAIPDLDKARILFTPNFAPRDEYAWALQEGLQVTLDNLYPLKTWPDLFAGKKLFIRIDPGQGRGHHEHVKTGGKQSKFGVPLSELDELEQCLHAVGADVIGIHAHSGSGILDPDNWRSVAATLAQVAERFPAADVLDLGGGLGVPDRAGDAVFDLAKLDEMLREIKNAYPKYRLWLEPGRYLVAQAGVLLTRVTQTKGKGDMRYIGVNTGMNSLIRPALYGAWHEIVNLTRIAEVASESVTVVGPICETGDKLGTDRMLPPSSEGDVIAICNAGAYGRVMSSRYNLREPAEELFLQP